MTNSSKHRMKKIEGAFLRNRWEKRRWNNKWEQELSSAAAFQKSQQPFCLFVPAVPQPVTSSNRCSGTSDDSRGSQNSQRTDGFVVMHQIVESPSGLRQKLSSPRCPSGYQSGM